MADGRIQAGQDIRTAISARAWNRAQEAADLVLGGRPSLQGGPVQSGVVPYTWCYAKNTTASTVPRWGVLSVDGLEIAPTAQAGGATAQFEAMPVLSGRKPTSVDVAWVVAVEPIAAGKIGRVAVGGVVQCKVNIDDDDDELVSAGDSVDELVSGISGQGAILWKEDGTGQGKWALIRLGSAGFGVKLGKTVSEWSKNATHSVRLYPSGIISAKSQTATNKFADVASGKWVMIAKEAGGQWHLIAAEC